MTIAHCNEAIRERAQSLDWGKHGGWVKSIVRIDEALLAPHDRTWTVTELDTLGEPVEVSAYNGGAYTRDGAIVPEAIHMSGSHRNIPDARPATPALARLPGRWLFGGQIRGHFGHFLVESLGRLWGLKEADVAGIVFVNFAGNPSAPLGATALSRRAQAVLSTGFVRDMLDIVAPGLPIHCVTATTAVDELIVPTQLVGNFNYGDFVGGHPAFKVFIDHAMARLGTHEPHRRIYVSRSGLGAGKPRFLDEDFLDRCFAEEGYEIIHPQDMGIRDQIRTYKEATEVVLATGSAAHLVALSTHRHLKVTLLSRSFADHTKFKTQLTMMGAGEVRLVEAARSVVRPADDQPHPASWGRRDAVIDLDVPRLWIELAKAGTVRPRPFDQTTLDVSRGKSLKELRGRYPDLRIKVLAPTTSDRGKPFPAVDPSPRSTYLDMLHGRTAPVPRRASLLF